MLLVGSSPAGSAAPPTPARPRSAISLARTPAVARCFTAASATTPPITPVPAPALSPPRYARTPPTAPPGPSAVPAASRASCTAPPARSPASPRHSRSPPAPPPRHRRQGRACSSSPAAPGVQLRGSREQPMQLLEPQHPHPQRPRVEASRSWNPLRNGAEILPQHDRPAFRTDSSAISRSKSSSGNAIYAPSFARTPRPAPPTSRASPSAWSIRTPPGIPHRMSAASPGTPETRYLRSPRRRERRQPPPLTIRVQQVRWRPDRHPRQASPPDGSNYGCPRYPPPPPGRHHQPDRHPSITRRRLRLRQAPVRQELHERMQCPTTASSR